ncbi:MAG TPA: tetratricopeptide repeat protein, partial [Gammaproteobacteria bacterium]|nr:tetratricopeptide repeat protein [Gammaproteobacteria bacterium]
MIAEKLRQARQYHQAGEAETAARLYHEILDDAPDSAEALYWLGVLEFQNGRTGESETLLRRATGLQPANSLALYSLGVVLAASGQYKEAITFY